MQADRAQIIRDNGDGIHLAVLEDGKPVYVHRFDNIDGYGENCRDQLGQCIVELVTEGFDADEWEGNDLDDFPTIYDELCDDEVVAEIEF